jgi:hypothetical protein
MGEQTGGHVKTQNSNNSDSSDQLLNHALIRGAIAGVVATVPMTWAIREIDPNDAAADDELIPDVVRKSGYPLDADDRRLAAYVARFGFGAFAGVVYALAAPKLKTVRPEVKGPLFGLALWGACVVSRKASGSFRMTPAQQAVMMSSHLAWGLAVTRLLRMPTSEIVKDLAMGVMGHTPFTKKLHKVIS